MKKNDGYIKGRLSVGRTVTAQAPAKINLHLEVLRQRHDGYHEIETILQAISLFDEVSVTLVERYPGGEPHLQLTVNGPRNVPQDEKNLCWQAARHFCRTMGVSGSLVIQLVKSIPAGAGLGGGSSDAAAVLMSCNHLFGTNLEPSELEQMGADLGADVPFFVRGGTAMGRGIGTDLVPLPQIGISQILLVKPPVALSTRDIYRSLKMGLTVHGPKANIKVIRPMLARFPQESWPGFNRLEDVVLPSQPAIQRIVYRLRDLAPVAMLSGSGATAFAVLPSDYDLGETLLTLAEPGIWVKIVEPYAGGVCLGTVNA